jgi:peptide/nickel transport system substrate-binding protein
MAASNSLVQANLADVASVQVVSDYVVQLNLKAPSTTVLAALAGEQGGDMISPKALHNKNLGSHPVGTGAYVISSFTPGQQVVYTRRTDKGGIWDPATGKPAKIVITAYSSPQAFQNALTSGQANVVTWFGDKTPYQTQIAAGQLQGHIMSGVLDTVGINFNRAVKPFNNPLVRQAVNYAINRNAIVSAFSPGSAPRVQPWPQGLPGFDPSRENAYPYDPAKAKSLLKQAGYPNGFNGGTFLNAQSSNIPQAAQAVQADLAAVGIKINLQEVNDYSLVSQWATSHAPADIFYMSQPSIDASQWLQRLYANRVWVPTGPDAQMAALIAGTDNPTLSSQALAAKVSTAINYATSNALYAPLWQGAGGYMASTKVKGLDNLASVTGGVADFRDVYIVK